ncbi:MAG: T9SS type A sorting domain-containing protein [Janthinobacterium lividum]
MPNAYTSFLPGTWGRRLSLALLVGGSSLAAHAQSLNYASSGATAFTGTYADLGTTGTLISTTSTDDANSVAQSIGFSFAYNGSTFTQFVFNTNGVIRLGSAAPSTALLYYDNNTNSTNNTDPLASTLSANTNLLMPFNFDLIAGTGTGGAEYRVATTGTTGSRVCTIQWKNVSDKTGAGVDVGNVTQFANFNFQLKLYETTNIIEFVYGPFVASTGIQGRRYINVGLKGSGLNQGQVLVATKLLSSSWNTTLFQGAPYTGSYYSVYNQVLPVLGSTYRFVPATVTATLNRTSAGFTAEASPVPFRDHLTLHLQTPTTGLLTLTLHDAVGRLVRETATTVAAGASTIALPETTGLPAGVYLLTVRQNENI